MKQTIHYEAPETEVLAVEPASVFCTSAEKVSSVNASNYGFDWDDDSD